MSEWLSAAELAALPDGTPVEITWSGGNGPHVYVVEQKGGTTYAQPPENPSGPLRWYNPVCFIGPERYHTKVRIIERLDKENDR